MICAVSIHWLFAEHSCSYIERYLLKTFVWAWLTNVIMYVLYYQIWHVLYLLIDYLHNVHTRKVLHISVYGLSSFIVRNVRVHSTSKNQCTCFCGLPATYTLHTICLPIFLGAVFRNVLQEHTTENNASEYSREHRSRVVSPRGTWYPHKQQLPAGCSVAEPGTLRASSHSPRATVEPTPRALDPNPSSHRHPRRTSLRHVRRIYPVTGEETEPYYCS